MGYNKIYICCERFVFYGHILCAHKKCGWMPVRPVCLLHFGRLFFFARRDVVLKISKLVIYMRAVQEFASFRSLDPSKLFSN